MTAPNPADITTALTSGRPPESGSTRCSILGAALHAGFASLSAFNESLRRRYGLAPALYRTRILGNGPVLGTGEDRRTHRTGPVVSRIVTVQGSGIGQHRVLETLNRYWTGRALKLCVIAPALPRNWRGSATTLGTGSNSGCGVVFHRPVGSKVPSVVPWKAGAAPVSRVQHCRQAP